MDDSSEKSMLLDKAVDLFSLHRFENVSVEQLAQAAKMSEARFYELYGSKDELLAAIYDYYDKNFFANAKSLEEIQDILKTGTAQDIIKVVVWNFYGMPESMHHRMTSITKIIYARFLIDQRANSIFVGKMTKKTIEEAYLKLETLQRYGRLSDDLDVLGFAELVAYIGLMTGIVGIANNFEGSVFRGVVDAKMYLKDILADYLDCKFVEPASAD